MRAKGRVMFGVVVAYGLLIAGFVFHQKGVLLREFDQIRHGLEADAILKQVETAAFHAGMSVLMNGEAPDRAEAVGRIEGHFAQLRERHAALLRARPAFPVGLERIEQALVQTRAQPTQSNMNLLVRELAAVKSGLAQEAERAQQARVAAALQYRSKTDRLALVTLVLGMAGLGLLGAIPGVFFKRLTSDLRRLQERALDIMHGYRGQPLAIRRSDELGQLMRAVNSMATTLDEREKELVVERQKVFHQEKMAAIGTLAAGVAHEIGNPIAAMAGVLQELVEREHTCASGAPCDRCRFDLLQSQIERLSTVTREISELAAPGMADSQLLDLNAQVRSTAALLRYDRRMQEVGLELDLDPLLPAVHGIPDQLVQVIMNLLINAVDALEGSPQAQPHILLRTRLEDGQACLYVADNGPGMTPEVCAQAFEPFFTTKPAGKGTGLGLSLCHSIVQAHGGGIGIASQAGQGTQVRVVLPAA